MEWNNKEVQEGKLERLERLTQKYFLESKDYQFTEYLQKFQIRIREQKYQVDLLQSELERTHQMYLRRMELAGVKADASNSNFTANVCAEPGAEAGNSQGTLNASPVHPAQNKNGVEFVIGTVLLSVVGGAFILTALVMLGMNFMNGFVKGMCLYAGALLILLVSELVIYRRWHKLGMVFSGIGIGSLYLATVLNYLSLHNFAMWPAVMIVLIITLLVILLSRTRDSAVYRVLGMISCYLCFLTIKEGITDTEFWVLSAILFVINMVYICMPLQKNRVQLGVMHMFTNLIFTCCMLWRGEKYNIGLEPRLGFILCMVALMQMLLGTLLRYQRKQTEKGEVTNNEGISLGYGVCSAFYLVFVRNCLKEILEGNLWIFQVVALAVGIVCVAAILAMHKYKEKWYVYYFMNYAILLSYLCTGNEKYFICSTLVALLLVKILSLWKIPTLRVHDAVITALSCAMLFYYNDVGAPYSYLLLSSVLICVLFISQWQTYYEILLTFTLGIYAVQHASSMLRLPLFVGIMFIGILVFHNVKRWKGRGIMVYNVFALLGEGVCFLMLLNPVYQNAYIIYLFLLIFGLATIVLTFQEKYQMDFKHKHLMLAIFLTYMALVVRTGLPIINSILLMLIALVCVEMGFAVKKKSIRIYGLVLSLIICGKIVLYDYWGAATLQKTILFFVVGIIALTIAGIYIILEKKNNV